MTLRETLKNQIREELRSQANVQGARIGIVSLVNSDGSAVVVVDGKGITADLLYPVVKGQQVVLVPGDAGKFSCAPTLPNAAEVVLEQPPFFSGAVAIKLRFAVVESWNSPLSVRFQDSGSRKVYRLSLPPAYSLLQSANFSSGWSVGFSPNGTRFVIAMQDPGTGAFHLLSYKLPVPMTSAGDIDVPNHIYAATATLENDYMIDLTLEMWPIFLYDCFVDNSGIIWASIQEISTITAPSPQDQLILNKIRKQAVGGSPVAVTSVEENYQQDTGQPTLSYIRFSHLGVCWIDPGHVPPRLIGLLPYSGWPGPPAPPNAGPGDLGLRFSVIENTPAYPLSESSNDSTLGVTLSYPIGCASSTYASFLYCVGSAPYGPDPVTVKVFREKRSSGVLKAFTFTNAPSDLALVAGETFAAACLTNADGFVVQPDFKVRRVTTDEDAATLTATNEALSISPDETDPTKVRNLDPSEKIPELVAIE